MRRFTLLLAFSACLNFAVLPLNGTATGAEVTLESANAALNFFSIAYDYAQKGEYAVAIELYRSGLKLDPNNQKAHYYLGEALEGIGGHQQDALAEYKIARDLNATNETGALALARIIHLQQAPNPVTAAPRRNSPSEASSDIANLRDADIPTLQKAAARGNRSAQGELGLRYATGRGIAQDYRQAVDWFRRAAEQGDANGQTYLGVAYEYGYSVSQDYQQAMSWYLKAAEQGNAMAQNNIGAMYVYGRGVWTDYEQGLDWYRKAAAQGFAMAQNNLGLAYHAGLGVPKDDQKAVNWYHMAADQNLNLAQFNLALMYERGEGVKMDDEQALYWYRKAGAQGYTEARDRLCSGFRNARSELFPERDQWCPKVGQSTQ